MYKKLPPFKWFVLQNFPFIEADFDAITEYQLLCKVVEYLNKNIEKTNELGIKVEELNEWFNNLDVQDEINNKLNEMVLDGTLADIINQEIFSELNDKIDNVDEDLSIEKNKILNLQNKVKIDSIKNTLVNFPLLMIKKFLNGTTGDSMSAQGMTAKYKSDGTIDTVFIWGDYTNYSRLYIVKVGNLQTGLGFEYTFTDNVPNVHGSCLSYKDEKIYFTDFTSGLGRFGVYDINADSYQLVDLPEIIPYYISGISWDSESETFLVCADNNNKMYVLDENYNLLRQYSHNYSGHNNYVMQGFDYKNGFEYRTVSSSVSNFIFIFDTLNGNLLKTVEIGYVNGEIEDISVNKGFALLNFNDFNPSLDNISMHCVCLSYLGGYIDSDIFSFMQTFNFTYNAQYFNNYGSKLLQRISTLYYKNDNDNDEIIRYAGIGSQENPFKSGLALSYFICSLSNYASQSHFDVNILESSNTDDNRH